MLLTTVWLKWYQRNFLEEGGKSGGFFLFSITLDCFFRILWIKFGTGWTNHEDVSACLANASINDNFAQCSILRLATSPSAPFRVTFVEMRCTMWNDVVPGPRYGFKADAKGVWERFLYSFQHFFPYSTRIDAFRHFSVLFLPHHTQFGVSEELRDRHGRRQC